MKKIVFFLAIICAFVGVSAEQSHRRTTHFRNNPNWKQPKWYMLEGIRVDNETKGSEASRLRVKLFSYDSREREYVLDAGQETRRKLVSLTSLPVITRVHVAVVQGAGKGQKALYEIKPSYDRKRLNLVARYRNGKLVLSKK